jgi:Flavin containing amine oxidoreductase
MIGCEPRVVPLEGELLGPDIGLGHRLRGSLSLVPADTDWQQVPVVIVGGGIAGLSAGWRLQQAGFDDFVLLELEDHFGGTSCSGSTGSFQYPWAAHYITTPMPENLPLIQLLKEMGVVEDVSADGVPVVAEHFLCREPEERVFCNGVWLEGLYPGEGASSDDLRQKSEFDASMANWALKRDAQGRRLFSLPIATGSDDAEVIALDRESMVDWLNRQGWTSPLLHWYVDYCCRDDYGLPIERTSAWAGILYFAARMRKGSKDSQDVITWPSGNGHIVQHLTARLSQQLLGGQLVCQIAPSKNQAEPFSTTVLAYDKQRQRPIGIRTDRVIFAVPQFLAPHLIQGFSARTGRSTADFQYSSWLVANVHLRDRPQENGFPLCWDNILYGSRSLGYVVSTHQTGNDHGPTVFTWYYPFTDISSTQSREKLLQLEWADWADLVLADLSLAHPDIRSLVTRVDIMRWGHAMIQPYPRFVWGPARKAAATPDGTIHFANTDLSGIALMEEAFYHGVRAADEVLLARAS